MKNKKGKNKKTMSEERKFELVTEWLLDYGRNSTEVFSDEGGDFIYTDPLEGEMEEEGMTMFAEGKKIYLPEELQRE
jgi:hypothetical protein